jgi:hypothetical protein
LEVFKGQTITDTNQKTQKKEASLILNEAPIHGKDQIGDKVIPFVMLTQLNSRTRWN